ncbi:hypothetical protein I8751_10520 [Nostocaceae cyanobacterium CENA357]|uniref:Uncharacterized protein n=1 Tax=Atlanticothrix silvestris CENA357 TaxID=1725252 RepID=A0A8J7HD19_9CYAN|nr:hypothetical protein [Atlanticothrix silvestris CENA357]
MKSLLRRSQCGLLPRGDAKSDGGFHATCYNGGNLRNAVAPHEQLALETLRRSRTR